MWVRALANSPLSLSLNVQFSCMIVISSHRPNYNCYRCVVKIDAHLFLFYAIAKKKIYNALLIRLLIASNGICWIWIRVWFTLADLIGVKMKTQQKSNWKFPFPFQHPARESKNTKQCGRQLQTHKHWKQHKSFAFQIREYVWSATSIHYKYITFANALEWNKCRLFIIRLRWQLNSNQCATL